MLFHPIHSFLLNVRDLVIHPPNGQSGHFRNIFEENQSGGTQQTFLSQPQFVSWSTLNTQIVDSSSLSAMFGGPSFFVQGAAQAVAVGGHIRPLGGGGPPRPPVHCLIKRAMRLPRLRSEMFLLLRTVMPWRQERCNMATMLSSLPLW
jgi:hypothetical protein